MDMMTARHVIRTGFTILCAMVVAAPAQAKVNTDGLVLKAASRVGQKTNYSFMGMFEYSYKSGDRTYGQDYEAAVKAQWDPMTKEAREAISYQRIKFEGGEVAAIYQCSADPFLARPGAWPECKRTTTRIESRGSKEGEAYWQKILTDVPLTFRRANYDTAQAMFQESASKQPTAPPPPPAPGPTAKPTPGPSPGPPGVTRSGPAGQVARSGAMDFPNPSWRGRRVDLCLRFSADCGQPAADEFCLREGYTRASAWSAAPRIGHTHVLGDNKPCDDPRCDGFASISCAR
jgi:hypothetical protein